MKFTKLVIAFRRHDDGAREQLLQAYDTVLSADACASLCLEDHRGLSPYDTSWLIGTRARLASVGSIDAVDWLQRIKALPNDASTEEIASALVAAVRARLRPEDITTEMLYNIANPKRNSSAHQLVVRGARLVVRTLLEDPDAPRYFGLAWPSEGSIPFKTEWLLEILDQQIAEAAKDEFTEKRSEEQTALIASRPAEGGFMGQDKGDPVLNDYLSGRRDKQMRERVRRLTPKVAMSFAYSAKATNSQLVSALLHDAPYGFIDTLAKIAAEEDPSLQPLLARFNAGGANWKPSTVEQWELLSEGQLWPLLADNSPRK